MEPEGVRHRMVEVAKGVRLHVAEAGPEDGPAVLLVHGFPDLWYGWRHQMAALAARGFRAVAPDMRGYGDSDAPPSAGSYSIFHLVGDLVALIADLAQPQVLASNPFALRDPPRRPCSLLRLLFHSRARVAGVRGWTRLGRTRGMAALPAPAGPCAGAR